uniref:Uncharacterized protein n=1 Tax=Trypanosoma congolense (strain IL3000) TaxID=1068625 RepID=G0UR56_TRYCI|nr:hypothetical protein, unlikely [Trypanosoma congolense IL3000]
MNFFAIFTRHPAHRTSQATKNERNTSVNKWLLLSFPFSLQTTKRNRRRKNNNNNKKYLKSTVIMGSRDGIQGVRRRKEQRLSKSQKRKEKEKNRNYERNIAAHSSLRKTQWTRTVQFISGIKLVLMF